MKKEELFNIIGEVDEQKVGSAGVAMNKKKSRPLWLKWGAMAACLCLVVVGAFIAPNLGDDALDYVETVIYNNAEYVVCGEGETNILQECGLPTEITEDLAGEHLGYLEQSEKNTFVVTDNLEDSKVELFEYAPQPNDNVYILCIDGEYFAAIRRDSTGYHGLSEIEADTVQYHDKILNKSDLSAETLEWLEWFNGLSETGQLSVSFVPHEILELCGYVSTENSEVSGPTE